MGFDNDPDNFIFYEGVSDCTGVSSWALPMLTFRSRVLDCQKPPLLPNAAARNWSPRVLWIYSNLNFNYFISFISFICSIFLVEPFGLTSALFCQGHFHIQALAAASAAPKPLALVLEELLTSLVPEGKQFSQGKGINFSLESGMGKDGVGLAADFQEKVWALIQEDVLDGTHCVVCMFFYQSLCLCLNHRQEGMAAKRAWHTSRLQEIPCDWAVLSLSTSCPVGRCISPRLARIGQTPELEHSAGAFLDSLCFLRLHDALHFDRDWPALWKALSILRVTSDIHVQLYDDNIVSYTWSYIYMYICAHRDKDNIYIKIYLFICFFQIMHI